MKLVTKIAVTLIPVIAMSFAFYLGYLRGRAYQRTQHLFRTGSRLYYNNVFDGSPSRTPRMWRDPLNDWRDPNVTPTPTVRRSPSVALSGSKDGIDGVYAVWTKKNGELEVIKLVGKPIEIKTVDGVLKIEDLPDGVIQFSSPTPTP